MDTNPDFKNLANIGIFAPLMIYSALNKTPPKILKHVTVLFAVGTIVHGVYSHFNRAKMGK